MSCTPGPDVLADRIYEAALEPEAWTSVLGDISRAMHAESTHLFAIDREGAPVFGFLGGEQGDAGLAEYHAYYHALDPRVAPSLRLPAGTFVPQAALVNTQHFRHSEFFDDFYRPLGLREMAGAVLARVDGVTILAGVHRGGRAPGFAESGVALLDGLAPHLARAARLAGGRKALAQRAALALDTLDALAVGVVAVDERGRPLLCNAAARRLHESADGLTLDGDAVTAAKREDTLALLSAIARTVQGRHEAPPSRRPVLRLTRPSGKPPLEVTVMPARRQSVGAHGEAVLLLVSDPARDWRGQERLLSRLYGLTAAEARVASRLAEGMRPDAIACALRISVETVRWTLKQIYGKTGARSQAQLVAMLHRGSAGALRGDGG